MKYFQYLYVTLLITLCSCPTYSQSAVVKKNIKENRITPSDYLDFIKICKWKNDAITSVIFTFYDNCKSHKLISEIFDLYNFKSTFFVVSTDMYVDSLKDISIRGHEIGNHTLSHPYLAKLDSSQLDIEIRTAKEILDKTLNIKCVSFAEPFASRSPLSIKIALMYHLFLRDYAQYSENQHSILTISPKTSTKQLSEYLKTALYTGKTLEIEGHGIDGDGYEPLSRELLENFLNIIKKYSDAGNIWVSTYKECGSYENLYHELSLYKEQKGDTVILTFKNYNRAKYLNLDSLPISIEIPYSLSEDLNCITNSVDVTKKSDKFVITYDLKQDTSFVLILKGLKIRHDSINASSEKTVSIYPNPVNEILNITCIGDIVKYEIYDLAGKLQSNTSYYSSRIDVSQLRKGNYIIKITAKNGISVIKYKSKFEKTE